MTYIIFIIGLLIGSFLNVCIYRIPKEKSIAYPPSHCPNCNTNLKPIDLIPVLSFVMTMGKCRYCKEKISVRYPLIEIANAITYLVLYLKFSLSILFIKYSILFSLLLVISLIDYDFQIIPDKLILFGIIVFFITHILYNFKGNLWNGTIGLIIGGGLFYLIMIVTKGGMGGGDVTLMGMLGFALGWKSILLITLLSFILGAIISILLIALKIKGRKDFIPFGPFIALAAVIVVLYGDEILNWYLKTLV